MLKLSSVCTSTATTLYHRFFDAQSLNEYNPHVVAFPTKEQGGYYGYSSWLPPPVYISHRKLTNCHAKFAISSICLHKKEPPLDVSDRYWKLRDSLVTCEFVVLRALGFRVAVDNPHQYLLHYLKLLSDWLNCDVWKSTSLPALCWTLLNDSCHTQLCLQYTGEEVAVGILYMGLHCCRIEIPFTDGRRAWWKVLCRSCDLETIQKIGQKLIDFYDSDE
ncbi:cyclin-Q-like isoform X1 [Oscarella lobularis]|uniref:cyclin-Q-like isoform X1 n=1 Tax=Oscarella lobularis TaxID=121494 RepID=UPI0033144480